MEWREEGIVLGVRRHGETSAIVDLLTGPRGRWMGLVRGGRSRTHRPVLQEGNLVLATWRARLEEHLGLFRDRTLGLAFGMVDRRSGQARSPHHAHLPLPAIARARTAFPPLRGGAPGARRSWMTMRSGRHSSCAGRWVCLTSLVSASISPNARRPARVRI